MAHPIEEALERADAMVEHGTPRRAVTELERVLFRFPEDARPVVRLAELYIRLGEKGSAASYYLQALKLDPPDPELQGRMGALLGVLRPEVEALASGGDGLKLTKRRRSIGLPRIQLDDFEIQPDILDLVPRELAARFRVVPVARAGEVLLVATANPGNRRAVEEVGFVTGLTVNCALATDAEISTALRRYYGLGPNRKKR